MKNFKNYKGYALYILLTCVLCVGCNMIEAKHQRQSTVDSLEVEFWRQDSLCKYYHTKHDGYSQRDTFSYYSAKTNKCTDEMLRLHREIVKVRDGNAH